MGLFWSMKQDPGQERGQRYMKRKAISPQVVTISIFGGHLSWDEIHSNQPVIATETVKRFFKRDDIKRIVVRQGRIRGTLFIPPGNGPFPGIIDMFGTVGGTFEFRAAMFANRGFISFVLAYLGLDGLPMIMEELELSYFQETVRWILHHPLILKSGIGVCGTSKGGEIALIMSTVCPEIKAVVNINGTPFLSVFPIQPLNRFVEFNEETLLRDANGDPSVFISKNTSLRHFSKDKLTQTWKTDVKILYITREDDLCVHPCYGEIFYTAYPEEKRHNVSLVRYPGAGHLIEPPYLPHCSESYNKMQKVKYIVWKN